MRFVLAPVQNTRFQRFKIERAEQVSGDRVDIDTKLKHVRRELTSRAYAVVSNKDDADDIVQDTLIGLVRCAGLPLDQLHFLSYAVFGCKLVDHIRRSSRQVKTVSLDSSVEDRVAADPFDLATGLMEAGIDSMPVHQRNAIVLNAVGLTIREVSDILGVPVTTVHNWCSSGRKAARGGRSSR